MSFKDEIISIQNKYNSEFNEILNFANTTERDLTDRFDKKYDIKPQGKERDELKKAVDAFDDMINGETNKKVVNINSSYVVKLLKEKMIPLRHKTFLMDMTLSYLISYQEAMFKDYLFVVLTNQKNALKSNTKITYKELLDYESLDELVKALAQKEVDQLGHGSIDGISDYIKDKFNITVNAFDKWDLVVEATYRRNLVIHNKGITNDVYCKKIGIDKRGEKLSLDIDYIVKTSENLIELSNFFAKSFIEKFKL